MDNDCIDRNFLQMHNALKCPVNAPRHKILKAFVGDDPSSISVGCGGYEPAVIGTKYASDLQARAQEYLTRVGYVGSFQQGDVLDLPFKYLEFKVGVCSEVIEHLNTEQDVSKAFSEIHRVAEKWIVTTPCKGCSDPDHKFLFTEDQLHRLIGDIPHEIFKYGYFFYISNDKERLGSIISSRP